MAIEYNASYPFVADERLIDVNQASSLTRSEFDQCLGAVLLMAGEKALRPTEEVDHDAAASKVIDVGADSGQGTIHYTETRTTTVAAQVSIGIRRLELRMNSMGQPEITRLLIEQNFDKLGNILLPKRSGLKPRVVSLVGSAAARDICTVVNSVLELYHNSTADSNSGS